VLLQVLGKKILKEMLDLYQAALKGQLKGKEKDKNIR
jgi:hypothetical protein